MKNFFLIGCIALLAIAHIDGYADQPSAPPSLIQRPAAISKAPLLTPILAVSRAGSRIVAVGDRGVVLLSDDEGKSYRQAKAVPTRAALTAVRFVDEKYGWAVGHLGVILGTRDGGESWSLLRDDMTVDQPLFSVWFKDRNEGIASGLFSLLLKTHDGGKSWRPEKLPTLPGEKRADVNLFCIFPDRHGNVFMTGEQGLVFISHDDGNSWDSIRTGNKGTFWAGVALDDGSILVAGLRGNIYRSEDGGKSWAAVDSGTKSSITDLVQLPDGRVFAVALDGVSLTSDDRGHTFKVRQRADQRALTALTISAENPILFSDSGVVKD